LPRFAALSAGGNSLTINCSISAIAARGTAHWTATTAPSADGYSPSSNRAVTTLATHTSNLLWLMKPLETNPTNDDAESDYARSPPPDSAPLNAN